MSSRTAPDAAINRLTVDDLPPEDEYAAMDVAQDLAYAQGRVLLTDDPDASTATDVTYIGPHARDQLVTVVHCRHERHGFNQPLTPSVRRVPTNAFTALDQLASLGTPALVEYHDVPAEWRERLPKVGGWD